MGLCLTAEQGGVKLAPAIKFFFNIPEYRGLSRSKCNQVKQGETKVKRGATECETKRANKFFCRK